MPKFRAALWGEPAQIARVYGDRRLERLAEITDLTPDIVTSSALAADPAGAARDVEVVFSTWGMPALTPEQLAELPRLRAVFYAAGSVQNFATPFLERGVELFSAWQSNAVPVAEFTLAQILLACKGYWPNMRASSTPEGRRSSRPPRGPGAYGETVALLGAGAIGRRVIELLRPFRLNLVVFDPFLPDAEAAKLGVELVTLEEAFARGIVVSNHLANNPQTRGMIGAPQFAQMREGATFINTGRGATVNEAALCAELARRPLLTALLDVTDPEPPLPNSPLYGLPNIHLTSHIAGSIGDEVRRMADAMIDTFEQWERGEDVSECRVTADMLDRMA